MEGGSRSKSWRSYSESEYESNLAWNKLRKVSEKMGKDLRTVTKVEEKVNDISKRLTKPSEGKSIWKKLKTPKQTVVELREMELKLIGIKKRFGLLISHWEIHGDRQVTNIDELRLKVNLIQVIAAQITELLVLLSKNVDDIGQSSTQRQLGSPDVEQFQALNINPNLINPNPDHVDDDESFKRKIDDFIAMIPTMVETMELPPKGKFMDVKALCENLALAYVRSNMDVDYEFVDVASHLIPVFSSSYGDGLHFNFFARQKATPSNSPAELFFVEVAFGDPQRVIRCVPLLHQPYFIDDEDRPARCIVFHPDDDEHCVYCDHAKDGSLERNFCLAPPLT